MKLVSLFDPCLILSKPDPRILFFVASLGRHFGVLIHAKWLKMDRNPEACKIPNASHVIMDHLKMNF